jgi:RNA polymerase sigma factor (sigma-70 family)
MQNSGILFKSSDQELISRLKGVDIERRKSEEQFFASYSYLIKDGERKYSLPHDEVFNAYADAVLSVIDRIRDDSFKSLSSIKTYLCQVFYNKCVDLLRKKTTNKQSVHQTLPVTELVLLFSDSAKSIVQKMIEKTDFNLLKQKLNELGGNCRRLLLLWADGFKDQEIAAELEYKTAEVVKTSRLRCMDKLKQLYMQNKTG